MCFDDAYLAVGQINQLSEIPLELLKAFELLTACLRGAGAWIAGPWMLETPHYLHTKGPQNSFLYQEGQAFINHDILEVLQMDKGYMESS